MLKVNRDLPIKLFLLSWFLVLFSFYFGRILTFPEVTLKTNLAVAGCIGVFLTGYYVPFGKKFNYSPLKQFRGSKIYLLIALTVILSFLSIIFLFLKLRNLSSDYNFDFSLAGFTELRQERSFSGVEKGSNLWGILSSVFGGFPFLSGALAFYYSGHIKDWIRYFLLGLFIIGITITFLSGGRFGAFFGIQLIFFSSLLSSYRRHQIQRRRLFWMILFSILLIVVFGFIFILRLGNDTSSNIFQSVLSNLRGVSFDKELFNYYSDRFSQSIVFIFLMFKYYISHSIYELDVLLSSPDPISFPYWGEYQFYPFYLLTNKLGLTNALPIEEILDEIANPGVYFTYIGAFYLDFGLIGIFIATFIIGLVCGWFWRSFLKGKTLKSFYLSILLLIFLANSSIISVIGSAIFPGLIITGFFLYLFDLRLSK